MTNILVFIERIILFEVIYEKYYRNKTLTNKTDLQKQYDESSLLKKKFTTFDYFISAITRPKNDQLHSIISGFEE